jgi:hypothetical protein
MRRVGREALGSSVRKRGKEKPKGSGRVRTVIPDVG